MLVIEKKTQPELYKDVKFLSMGVSDDDTRYFMTGIYVNPEENISVATDGRRLHVMKRALPVEKGIWKVKVSAKEIILYETIDGQFPNYDRVIPEDPAYQYTLNWNPAKSFTGVDHHNIAIIAQSGFYVDINYYKPLFGYVFNVFFNDDEPNRAITFENGDIKAVIMPMQKPDIVDKLIY